LYATYISEAFHFAVLLLFALQLVVSWVMAYRV
jgi:hypothetical protein